MTESLTLARSFLAALPASARRAAPEASELAPVLQRSILQAFATWPQLDLSEEELVRWAAEKVSGQPLLATLEDLRWPELLLTCACARGSPRALEAFERTYFGEVGVALSRNKGSPVPAEDLAQMLREKLFLRRGDQPPRIAEYSGRGELRNWLRVVLSRTLIDLTRARREVPVPERQLVGLLNGPINDPELEHIKRIYRAQLEELLPRAFNQLPTEDRILLRYRFVDEMSLEQLAALYAVDRTTAVRRLARVRQALLDQMRSLIATHLKVDLNELRSIVRLVQSQIDLRLGDPESPGED